MAHELTIRADGTVEAMYADAAAWHGLGTVVEGAKTSEEAIAIAHLDWTVETGQLWGGPSRDQLVQAPDLRTIYRGDTGAILGTASKLYQPFQNAEAFAFLDSLLEDGTMVYESAGSLRGGKQIWALGRLAEGMQVGGEEYGQYMLVTAGHDGKTGIKVLPTTVRVVCANTLSVALGLGEKERRIYSISHLPGIDARLQAARDALEITTAVTRAQRERLEALLTVKLTAGEVEDVVHAIFGQPSEWSGLTRGKADRFGEIVDEEIARNGRTAYSMLQGITGYADHGVKVIGKGEDLRAERRFSSVFFGAGSDFKVKGIKALEEVAKVALLA